MRAVHLLIAASLSTLGCDMLKAETLSPPTINPDRCAALNNMSISAVEIKIPTSGGRIAKASWVAAGTGNQPFPDHCLVAGLIGPVDRSAPDIEFNLALPARWNEKTFMLGGGGTDGYIPPVTEGVATIQDSPTPLSRGYAVFSSDSGHKNKNGNPVLPDATFGLNREAYLNYVGDALKKTHDAANVIIRKAYGRAPVRSYFIGGSGGGREAFSAAGRWPEDWDGIVAMYPAADNALTLIGILSIVQALAEPGRYPSPEKRDLLHRAALEACDSLDGLKDAVISNVRACRHRFDPSTAQLSGAPLRCPDGEDNGADCLSDAELATFKKLDRPIRLPFALASGLSQFPGFNTYTADTGRTPSSPAQDLTTFFGFGLVQPATPSREGMPFTVELSSAFFRYILTQNPELDILKYNVADPRPYAARLREVADLDRPNFDLHSFFRRDGKVLMLQGTDDLIVSPRATEAVYTNLQRTVGRRTVARSLRYYEVPGFGHTVSAIFDARWDPISALEDWVERGADPGDSLIVTDATGTPGRTRPLCRYPAWPKYESGDANVASSFKCVTN